MRGNILSTKKQETWPRNLDQPEHTQGLNILPIQRVFHRNWGGPQDPHKPINFKTGRLKLSQLWANPYTKILEWKTWNSGQN